MLRYSQGLVIVLDYLDLLNANKDLKYKDFQSSLIPNISSDSIIGVRTPILRRIVKNMTEAERAELRTKLPHSYFEENQLHAFSLGYVKSLEELIEELDLFLPYVDNWATCDQISVNVKACDLSRFLDYVLKLLAYEHTYTRRFAIRMLMKYFLDDLFEPRFLSLCNIKTDDYYLQMMEAWYYAEAMVRQRDAMQEYIKSGVLSDFVHRMTISKCIDSYRIPDDLKEYLKSIRR